MDVLGHIADDRGELDRAARLLGPGALWDTFMLPLDPIVGYRLGKSVLGIRRNGVEAASPAA